MPTFHRAAAPLLLAAAMLAPLAARADTELRGALDVTAIVRQGEAWLIDRAKPSPRAEQLPDDPWHRLRPPIRLSVVARDWQSAFHVAGDDVLVSDLVRASRASRTMIARARVPFDGWSIFGQIGAGLWRADRTAIPFFLADTEYAGEVGAGAEVKIAKRGSAGIECDYTGFYRETREPQFIPSANVLALFLSLRAEF